MSQGKVPVNVYFSITPFVRPAYKSAYPNCTSYVAGSTEPINDCVATGETWSGQTYEIWCEGGYASCKMALEEAGGQISGYHGMVYPDYTDETFPVTKDTTCKLMLSKDQYLCYYMYFSIPLYFFHTILITFL